jgi:hypothetical protein
MNRRKGRKRLKMISLGIVLFAKIDSGVISGTSNPLVTRAIGDKVHWRGHSVPAMM